MNITKFKSVVVLGTTVTMMIGCGQPEQKEQASPPVVKQPTATPDAKTSQPAVKPTTVDAAVNQAASQIEKIKGLIADKKYPEALIAINELSTVKLAPEQQTLVSSLNTQIKTAMQAQAKEAAEAAVAAQAKKVAAEAKAAAEAQAKATAEAAAAAQAKAKAAADAVAANQTTSDIEKIKGLIADKKYPEALNAIKALPALKLTPEQQKLVADLKAQIEAAMQAQATAQDPTKAVGGLLGN